MEEEIKIEAVPEKTYQILNGKSEDEEEYYTYEAPAFDSEKNTLFCTKIFKKLEVSRVVINKTIKCFYSSEFLEDKNFPLEDGVGIKTIETAKLTWIFKSKEQAEEALKDRELEVYREIIPKLVNQPQQTKNLFI